MIVNQNPEQGQFSSLQLGLQDVMNRGRDAAIVTLVDPSSAGVETIQQLEATFLTADERTWAVVPEHAGKHGHPIVIGREMISAFLHAPVTSSARDVEHAQQQHVLYVPVSDPLVALNVDTPEDFEKLAFRIAGLKAGTQLTSAAQQFLDSVPGPSTPSRGL